jgi:hypothetical protein
MLTLLLGLTGQARAATIIEDFEIGKLINYTAFPAFGGGNFVAAVTPLAAHDGIFGLRLDGDNWYVRNAGGPTLSQGDNFFLWERMSPPTGREYFAFGSSATQPGYSVVLAPNTHEFLIQRNAGFDKFGDLAAVPQTYLADTWYRVDVDWDVGGLITAKLFASDGVTLLNTVSATDNAVTSGGFGFRGFGGNGDFDTVTLVPEPSTVVLLGLGSLGLLGYGWRRQRRAVVR